jgi:hypothetical protein
MSGGRGGREHHQGEGDGGDCWRHGKSPFLKLTVAIIDTALERESFKTIFICFRIGA